MEVSNLDAKLGGYFMCFFIMGERDNFLYKRIDLMAIIEDDD